MIQQLLSQNIQHTLYSSKLHVTVCIRRNDTVLLNTVLQAYVDLVRA
jgi:REP element-mobilizing transposase RayT